MTDFGGKTSIFSHPVYLFLREFSLQDFRGGSLGEIVTEILKDGRNLSRKSLCAKLLCRLEHATGEEEQKHYNALIGLLFE
ncbi:regulatory protein YcgZ [Escherichia coli]|uniref:regulatory protein YcgZ n=1 Tax=Escherichia coli TaxID=562 RepID=UPI0021BA75C7|nr:regulatory protein YcgZ [Escherichia coli]